MDTALVGLGRAGPTILVLACTGAVGEGLGRWPRGGGGGGVTDSLSLGTNCKTTAPFFNNGQPLVLPIPNLQPLLFMDT